MNLLLLLALFSISYCQAQIQSKMSVYSSFREEEIIKETNSPTIFIDNSLRYKLVFTGDDTKKALISKEITEYSFNFKGTIDSVFTSKSGKKNIKTVNTVAFDDFQKLYDLFKQESVEDYEKQKVLTTPHHLSIELIKGNDTIKVTREDNPADYVNTWYCNGKEIFNPTIDQIIAKILPKMVLGDFRFIKIPPKKTIKYHKEELRKILERLTLYLQTRDSTKLKALAYELFPNITTVEYFEKNNLYYRGVPEAFEEKSEEEIKIIFQKAREVYASYFLRLLNSIEVGSSIELLTYSDEIDVEYGEFLKGTRGSSKVTVPRGNGAVENTAFYFKLRINDDIREYSFGEMLRVNNQWQSFTAPRL